MAKNRDKEMNLYNTIEKVAPEIIAEKRHIFKGVSPNVDFYSGFVYEMLGIPMELYTPLLPLRESLDGVLTGLRKSSA